MNRLIACIAAIWLPVAASAHNAPQHLFGFWQISSSGGWNGELSVTQGLCHFTLYSSFQSYTVPCMVQYDATSQGYAILPRDPTLASTHTTPDYQPGRAKAPIISQGSRTPQISLRMNTPRRDTATGQLLGAGGFHDLVYTRR